MVAFRNDADGRACLERWRVQCLEWCFDRVENGRFADQAYLDDWPETQHGVIVMIDPGIGLGPWNFMQFRIEESGSVPTVDGEPFVLFHFHGFRSLAPRIFDDGLRQYALAARGQDHHLALGQGAVHALGGHEAGHVDRVAETGGGDRALHRRALGAVAEDLGSQAGDRSRARATRGHERGHALLGDVAPGEHRQGTRGSGPGRGSSGPAYSPSSAVTSPRRPSARRRPACRREKQNARWRVRAHRRCTSQPTSPAPAQVLAPVVARPHLVPVDHEAEAAQRRTAAAASSEKYGNDAVCTTS